MLVVGIDPGSASGAVAWLHAEGRAGVNDLPLIAGALDPHALRSLLLDTPEPATAVYVEHVSAAPGRRLDLQIRPGGRRDLGNRLAGRAAT